jgi:hypothetical protein
MFRQISILAVLSMGCAAIHPQDAAKPAAPTGAAAPIAAAGKPAFPTVEQVIDKGPSPTPMHTAAVVELRNRLPPQPTAADGGPLPRGMVSVHVLISQTGVVEGITPIQTTNAALVAPAIEWASKWRFRSYSVMGHEVRMLTTMIVQFK